MKKNIFKFLKIFMFALLTLILFILLVFVVKAENNSDKYPDFMGYKPMVTLSGSMKPNLMVGDLVIVKEIDGNELKINDIIAFRNDDNTITVHRIKGINYVDEKPYFVTKGDNNNTADKSLVSFDDVEGIYVTRFAKIGNFVLFVQTPMGFAIITLALILVFFIGITVSNYLDNKKNKKYNISLEEAEEFQEYLKNKKGINNDK